MAGEASATDAGAGSWKSSVSERVALVMERDDVQRGRAASRPQRPTAQFRLSAY